MAQRYQLPLTQEDTEELVDLCLQNYEAGTNGKDNCKRVTVNFRGNIIKVAFNKELQTVVSVLSF